MMEVFVAGDSIISPLGFSTASNFEEVRRGRSGIRLQPEGYYGAVIADADLDAQPVASNAAAYTKFERLLILSVREAMRRHAVDIRSPRTAFIVSTTKGNIDRLAAGRMEELLLMPTARKVAAYFGAAAVPLVVSNACISGLLALLIGQRLIRSGQYDHAVVCGADLLTDFVLSGFRSFQAVSDEPCRPFDAERKGISLGEGAAAVILTNDRSALPAGPVIRLGEGASRNDANHISGPSRTGEELAAAIIKAMDDSRLRPEDLGFVSAHGTATLYNDEMESKAFHHAGLQAVPVNSLKGYYGHTLGAAGLIESIIGMESMKAGVVIPTAGFRTPGVPMPLVLSDRLEERPMQHFLKTTSGFGGCNAAMTFSLVHL
ncbi:beta-ketoacyl-[acyl-carrier-protein] synthase family protein [Chitinophaga lutea]